MKGKCFNTGRTHFPKGHIPWTKDKKGIHLSPSTEFKEGHKAWNDGTKGICKPNKTSFTKDNLPPTVFKKGRKAPKGKDHPNWKGGEYISFQGYVMILVPEHPFPDHPNGYVKRCRLIIEEYLGYYLIHKEPIHHYNKIKNDDRLENLMVFINNSAHRRFHGNPNNVKPSEIIFDGRNL